MTIPLQQAAPQQDGRLRQAQLKMLAMLEIIDNICQKHQLDYWLEGGTLLGAVRHQGFIPWDDDLDISMTRSSFETFLALAPSELPSSMWLQTSVTDPGYFNLSVPLKIRDRDSRFIELHEQGNEPYQQGIFIDVFVYDTLPASATQRALYKFLAKKVQRLLQHKYSSLATGHYAPFYARMSRCFSRRWLQNRLSYFINQGKRHQSPYWGYGYDCVNSNCITYDTIYPLKRTRFENGQFNIPHQAQVILTHLYGDYMTLPPEHERVMKHCQELIPELAKQ